jgi:hypothetical protein
MSTLAISYARVLCPNVVVVDDEAPIRVFLCPVDGSDRECVGDLHCMRRRAEYEARLVHRVHDDVWVIVVSRTDDIGAACLTYFGHRASAELRFHGATADDLRHALEPNEPGAVHAPCYW